MGASSSTHQISQEQQAVENEAASTGALPFLRKAFSNLSDPQSNTIPLLSLQELFSLTFKNPVCETSQVPECFSGVLAHIGPSIVDLFFTAEKGVQWIEFLRGYIRCCGRMSASMYLNSLYRLYTVASTKAGVPSKLEFVSDEADSKISGFFLPTDVLMLLWICWIMSQSSRNLNFFSNEKVKLVLPDIKKLILSAIVSCTEVGSDLNLWDCNISGLELQLPAQKFHMWILTTIPSLGNCFTQFVHSKLQRNATLEDKLDQSNSSVGESSMESSESHLLTCGRAWAISLTLNSTLSEEILSACTPGNADNHPLYRSSLHGKGLNRFWSKVEGYHGPLLILVCASSKDAHEDNSNIGRWVIGVLTEQGFENRDTFYGNSGHLYSIDPIFHVFSPSGKEKNFIYTHPHPTSRVYEPHPKPVGIAFGGSVGNERVFIDEDFDSITIRHHAVDKTFQSGSLVPNQGFLPYQASVLEVEVWGLAGNKTKEEQDSYKKREQLFTEQRRKVDLKTFGSWEDSPEKMMMDMISNPNAVKREDR